MALFYLINLIILSSVVGYFAWRLGKNFWLFFILSLLFSPIIGGLALAIYDYYTIFIKDVKIENLLRQLLDPGANHI